MTPTVTGRCGETRRAKWGSLLALPFTENLRILNLHFGFGSENCLRTDALGSLSSLM